MTGNRCNLEPFVLDLGKRMSCIVLKLPSNDCNLELIALDIGSRSCAGQMRTGTAIREGLQHEQACL